MNLIFQLKSDMEAAGLWQKDIVLPRNQHLKVHGSIDTHVYFVLSGAMRVYVMDEFDEHTIRFGYKDSFITALDSFISGGPSDICIQAIRKTTLKVVPGADFMQFIESSQNNLRMWTRILEQLVLQQLERERDLLTSSPQERYLRVFKRTPQVFQEIPHKYIASYLRMTPETLSRIKKS